jgi:hypothetical protein
MSRVDANTVERAEQGSIPHAGHVSGFNPGREMNGLVPSTVYIKLRPSETETCMHEIRTELFQAQNNMSDICLNDHDVVLELVRFWNLNEIWKRTFG